jgi:hypothetical protein
LIDWVKIVANNYAWNDAGLLWRERAGVWNKEAAGGKKGAGAKRLQVFETRRLRRQP